MDAMASGRPFVATGIPEARLYTDHIHVVSSCNEAVSTIRGLLSGGIRHDSRRQLALAKQNIWPRRADRFFELLQTNNRFENLHMKRAATDLQPGLFAS
jgi:hypothetical protein